jgi:hypothetical protein
MNPRVVIRNETDVDIGMITKVAIEAFKTLEIDKHTEQFIIEALRAAKALTVSLVAEMWPGRRTYCVLSRKHFRRYSKLVRAWICFGVVRIPTERYWQINDTGRAITVERPECPGVLSCEPSGLLHEIGIQEHIGTCT